MNTWLAIVIVFVAFACNGLAEPSVGKKLPPDSQYVVVDANGHLWVDGERRRFWAVIGKVYADNPASTDALIERFDSLGFNAVRLWDGFRGGDYEIGDGSRMDNADYFIAQAKKAGFRIWLAGMNRVGDARPDDVDIIDDPTTAEAWAAAVREMCEVKGGRIVKGRGLRPSIEKMWDPRMETLLIRDMTAIATHFNRHTGLRWCDDPVFAVWELSNEEWWMRKMVGGQWQKLPAFFKNQLVSKWNEFLWRKYGSDAALVGAWGKLLDGESLKSRTVLLIPMAGKSKASTAINDSNPHAQVALEAMEQEYSRDDFTQQRSADVLEFFMGLQIAHKKRVADAIKPLGKSTRLSPMIYDTGIGYEIQSQYLHQHADAVAHDAYVNGTGPSLESQFQKAAEQPNEHQRMRVLQEAERTAANEGPWVNWLRKPPGISQGVPWLEHNKVEGKPFLCYETQIQQPAKYRADYPLRLVALASIQDWDWVCWHYFGGGEENKVAQNDRHFDKPMDITTGSHPQGYHFTYDEVQSAMMRAAGNMFTGELVAPASNPTIFVYGRDALYDPMTMDYGGSYGAIGLDMLQTVYQYGARIRIDPSQENSRVMGPVVKFEDRNKHNPYTPTEQIAFDWKAGYLKLDAPAAVAFTGLMGKVGKTVQFKHGVVLSDVSIRNPEGIFEKIGDEKYIAFALYSQDGRPIDQSDRLSLSLVSTSFNTDFNIDPQTGKVTRGQLPVLVARVGGTVHCPALNGMRYTFRDWHLKPIGEGVVVDGRLVVPDDQPIFVVELERP